ncbi:hypothetical protein K438DRAFT_1789266 [Mycena galopus ATCC 62051]|nr:hypothetical protein K438DRAFT_1789266 [Mycena galopus ATCC 62051]
MATFHVFQFYVGCVAHKAPALEVVHVPNDACGKTTNWHSNFTKARIGFRVIRLIYVPNLEVAHNILLMGNIKLCLARLEILSFCSIFSSVAALAWLRLHTRDQPRCQNECFGGTMTQNVEQNQTHQQTEKFYQMTATPRAFGYLSKQVRSASKSMITEPWFYGRGSCLFPVELYLVVVAQPDQVQNGASLGNRTQAAYEICLANSPSAQLLL